MSAIGTVGAITASTPASPVSEMRGNISDEIDRLESIRQISRNVAKDLQQRFGSVLVEALPTVGENAPQPPEPQRSNLANVLKEICDSLDDSNAIIVEVINSADI